MKTNNSVRRKVFSFHLNGNTLGSYPQRQTIIYKTTLFSLAKFRISFTDVKVRTTLYSIINSTTGKHCSLAFIWMVTFQDFIHRRKSSNNFVQHIANSTTGKYCSTAFIWMVIHVLQDFIHRQKFIVPPCTAWSHFRISSTASKLEPPCTVKLTASQESTAQQLSWECSQLGFCPQTQS